MPSDTLVCHDLPDALEYQRREPETTVLSRVVRQNLETFLASSREQGRVVPRFTPLPPPSNEEVTRITASIARRVEKILVKKGQT